MKRSSQAKHVLRPALATLAVAGVLFYSSSHTPVEMPELSLIGWDKLAHFCYFGLLATHILRTLLALGLRRGLAVAAAVGLTLAYGCSDELHQSFVPGRSVGWDDIIADTLGALVASSAYAFWPTYQRCMRWNVYSRARQASIP